MHDRGWSQQGARTSGAKSTSSRYGLGATVASDGDLYALGGTPDGKTPSGDAQIYSPVANTWTALPSLPTPRLGLAAAATADGRVFAIGGRDGDGAPCNVVEIYTPSTKTWTAGAPMPTKRLALTAVTGADGRIYAIGGRDASNTPLGTVEVLDPATDTWSSLPSLATPRYWFGASLAPDGSIYVAGGIGGAVAGPLASVETFAPQRASAWTSASDMPESRSWNGAAFAGDGLYVIGGATDDGSPQSPPLATMLVYSPTTRTWAE